MIKSSEELLDLLIGEPLRQRSKSPKGYSRNRSNQRFRTVTLESSKSKIRAQARTDDLNRTPGTPFAVMSDKLLDDSWLEASQINGTAFEYAR
jgi:hypothetical protein